MGGVPTLSELVALAERVAGDEGALDLLCEGIAGFLGVPICTIYARERDGEKTTDHGWTSPACGPPRCGPRS